MNVDNNNKNNKLEIYGSGGGGGKGGGKSAPARIAQEDPDTLKSNAVARIIDVISEGEINGLVDGAKSVYLDNTPLQNADGTFNFNGIHVDNRVGLVNQSYMPGFSDVESTTTVNTQVTQEQSVTRQVTNTDADAVRVTIQVPVLTFQNTENGDLTGSSVDIAIDVRRAGQGGYTQVVYDTFSGKTTSPYERSYRINLDNNGPWDVRVRRITDDSTTSNVQNDTFFAYYTTIIDSKLTYPNVAYVGLKVSAELFGNSIPARSYDVEGIKVHVPTNYDPVNRTYSGIWDGTFKIAYTNNPAWIFYNLATNNVYGAGLSNVDKYSLYQIGRYCDEFVDDGYGSTEPRFTINTVLSTQEDVYTTLNSLSSSFRGMTYYASGTVTAVQDSPRNSSRIFTNANVVNGEFTRSKSSVKTRHTRIAVSWNDPSDNYQLTTELVDDNAGIQNYGILQKDITAFGCTSRGQARRLGLWTLYTEQLETETIEFSIGLDNADVRPGDVISINDANHVGARLSGRLKSNNTTTTVYLDQVPSGFTGANRTITIQMPDGSAVSRLIGSINSNNGAVTISSLNEAPLDNAVYMLSSSNITAQEYSVIAVTDNNDRTYTISALEHNKNKYARVEQGLIIPDSPTTLLPSGPLNAELSISVRTYTYIDGGVDMQAATVSWTQANDPRTKSYILEIMRPESNTFEIIGTTNKTSLDVLRVTPGEYTFRVAAIDGIGNRSRWSVLQTTIVSLLMPAMPDNVDVTTSNFNINLIPTSTQRPGQLYEFYRSTVALDTNQILSNAINRGRSTTLSDSSLSPDTQYFYYIRGWNKYGVSEFYPVQAKTTINPSELLQVLTDEIRESHLHQSLVQEIEKIDGPESLAGSVASKVAQESADRAQALLDAAENTQALIDAESTIREDADSALAETQNTMIVSIDNATSLITNLEQVVIDKDTATASRIDTLQSTVDNNHAYAVTTTDTLVTDVSALTTRVDNISAELDEDFSAIIQVETDARVAADSALAAQITTVQTNTANTISQVQQNFNSQIATVDNKTTANANAITAAQTQWNNNLTTAQSQLNSSISNLNGAIQANASSITNVQADIGAGLSAVRIEASANAGGLVINGNFESGDFTGWRSIWSGISVGVRNSAAVAGAIRTAPAKHFITFSTTGYDEHRFLHGDIFPAAGGESYSFKYDYAGGGSNIAINIQLYVVWIVEGGSDVFERVHQATVNSQVWQSSGVVQATAPAGTISAYLYPRRLSSGNGTLFMTNIIAQRTDIVAGSQWTAQVESNGLVGGFGIYNDGQTVDAGFAVDKFYIGRNLNDQVAPFIVNNNRVIIDDAIIDKLLFTKLRASNGSLVFQNGQLSANYINVNNLVVNQGQSTNYLAGTRGWRLTTTGGEINFPISFNSVSGLGSLATQNSLDSLNVPDTRNDNHPPTWYYSNYARQTITEFKLASVVGISGEGNYVSVTTKVPWSSSSGGAVVQEVVRNNGVYSREGTASAWTAWSMADNTSSNTAYDTARLAGHSASAFASSVLSARDRTNAWTRPGSTQIWGNQIATADAYVDTLQIQGNAVTVPVSAATGTAISIGSDQYLIVVSVWIDAQGSNVLVSASLGVTAGSISSFSVRRNGVDVVIRPGGTGALSFAGHVGAKAAGGDLYELVVRGSGGGAVIAGRSIGLIATRR